MTTQQAEMNAAVGHSIDSYLKYRHLSRADLASALHIGDAYLRDKIKGRRQWYFHEVATAASLLGVAIDELVGGSQNLKYLAEEPVLAAAS
jgi:hypothetical protein